MIVPVLGRYDLLHRLLGTIDEEVGEILIIDNGDELRPADLAIYPNVRLVSSPSNLGIATSWNLGIKMYPRASGWVILGADVWFKPGRLGLWFSRTAADQITTGANPPWACFHLGREVVERVGLFCERFHPAYFEDNDMERRAVAAGVKIFHPAVEIGHDNSAVLMSSPELQERNRATFVKNQAVLSERWDGLKPGDVPPFEDWSLGERCDYSWDG
jgi:GT2 family glycosyltransferase